jgi:hypothetical protein
MKLNISLGNSKLGKIPNISLPAIITCPKEVPCIEDCYCNSEVFYWKLAREKWRENWELYQANPYEYFEQLDKFLAKIKPAYFRYHVSGDCPDQNYADNMYLISMRYPDTQFLVFTKRFDYDFHDMPNLKIKYSVWPMWTTHKKPKAYVITKEEIAKWGYDKEYKICKGKCDDCYFCFETNEHVILPKH